MEPEGWAVVTAVVAGLSKWLHDAVKDREARSAAARSPANGNGNGCTACPAVEKHTDLLEDVASTMRESDARRTEFENGVVAQHGRAEVISERILEEAKEQTTLQRALEKAHAKNGGRLDTMIEVMRRNGRG